MSSDMTNQQYSALFHDPKWVNEALRAGNTGLWKITLYPEQERYEMVGNETMLELLGLDVHPEPGVCYQHWHERISPAYESQVVECVERIVSNHYAEVEYPWEHPVLGRIHIRCGGRLVGNHGNWFEIMGYHQDISEIQTMREQLAQSLSQLDQANHDALTGLMTRRIFFNQLGDWLTMNLAQRGAHILMADIDHFKAINDTHGHIAGDAVIRTVADCLRAELRADDLSCRFGGEEFCVLIPTGQTANAVAMAERIRRRCENTPAVFRDRVIPFRISIGLAPVPTEGAQGIRPDEKWVEHLLEDADQALYEAKRTGRNRTCMLLPGADGVSRMTCVLS